MRQQGYPTVLRAGLIALLGAVLALPTWMAVGPPVRGFAQSSVSESFPIVDGQTLLNAQGDAKNWLLNGHDYTNQRYSALDGITPENVAHLVPRYVVHTGVKGPIEASPIVADGMMFLTSAYSHVIAVDLNTGKIRWRYDPQLNPFVICCGPMNRGVAVVNGKVFLARLDDKLVALDEQNGHEIWVKTLDDWRQGYSQTMAPTVVGNAVFVGSAGNEYGVRGYVAAFDQNTGHELWRWWVVGPGWEGSWRTTTPDGIPLHRNIAREKTLLTKYREAWRTGGGAPWSTPAIDPQLHLMFLGTGNPAPQLNGDMRPGDNLYTESIVALDYRTGKLVWYYQYLPHDVWDYDAISPVVLFDLKQNGQTIPALSQAGKTGWVYILDRRNGHLIRRSQAFVPQQNMFAEPTAKGVIVAPGTSGGSEWSPTAYSPQTGYIYVLGIHRPQRFTAHFVERKPPQAWRGSAHPDLTSGPRWGTFTAIDTRTGKVAWQAKTPEPMVGGAVATGGGLVFTGEGNGAIDAFDARTGKRLWSYKANAGANAPPVVYEIGGREFVTIGAAGNFIQPYKYGDAFYTFAIPQPGEAGPIVIGKPPLETAAAPAGELTAGTFTTPAGAPKWMQVDADKKIVRLTISAAEEAKSSPFNFNGFSNGQLKVTVPKGWLVQIVFANDGDIPHSLEVTRAAVKVPIQGEPPAFPGATTPKLDEGLPRHQSSAFQFQASTPGRFRILCGVPGHAISGMWDYFVVSAAATHPSVSVGK